MKLNYRGWRRHRRRLTGGGWIIRRLRHRANGQEYPQKGDDQTSHRRKIACGCLSAGVTGIIQHFDQIRLAMTVSFYRRLQDKITATHVHYSLRSQTFRFRPRIARRDDPYDGTVYALVMATKDANTRNRVASMTVTANTICAAVSQGEKAG